MSSACAGTLRLPELTLRLSAPRPAACLQRQRKLPASRSWPGPLLQLCRQSWQQRRRLVLACSRRQRAAWLPCNAQSSSSWLRK